MANVVVGDVVVRALDSELRLVSADAEQSCSCFKILKRSSLLLAFSIALLSYSSHSFDVSPGVFGGVRGALNGDVALASGDE